MSVDTVRWCPRPGYSLELLRVTTFCNTNRRTGWFAVIEQCGQETNRICILQGHGDIPRKLSLRGIPADDAQRLAEQMDLDDLADWDE